MALGLRWLSSVLRCPTADVPRAGSGWELAGEPAAERTMRETSSEGLDVGLDAGAGLPLFWRGTGFSGRGRRLRPRLADRLRGRGGSLVTWGA